ncbi:nCTP synthase 1 [Spraguea lophii 42_110]|uniref:CTP synthase n=1 Tax=Spraguea lophii (strain 42_110) TaxID=1358809 RepID=S7XRC2_SPRLO|nr:nCTP synthase 1 [Spraguea lophii 42_110]
MKYIIVCGGTISGIGKGVVGSSIAKILDTYGHVVNFIKIDPYQHLDCGTISPIDHGEVFVLRDGAEVDLDFGSYERLLDVSFTVDNSITTGKIYKEIIKREREGKYLGKTVQCVPHVTDLIMEKIIHGAQKPLKKGIEGDEYVNAEVCMVELGGTVGDIESNIFCEALRQLKLKVGKENILFISVDYLPTLSNGEIKTKLIQNASKKQNLLGINPDIIVCNSSESLDDGIRSKISNFCEVAKDSVFYSPVVKNTEEIPEILEKQNIYKIISDQLKLIKKKEGIIKSDNPTEEYDREVSIGVIGKYTENVDAYLSINKALTFSAQELKTNIKIKYINSDLFEENGNYDLSGVDGVIIPGGFGSRGTEGKINAIRIAREQNIPLLGICLGFQLSVIEFCRNVLGINDATSAEFDPDSNNPVIIYMGEHNKEIGGTMRLGDVKTYFRREGRVKKVFNNKEYITERHRHRYEVNIKYIEEIEKNGMHFVATDKIGKRMEILEIPNLKFFVGTQYHPELTARKNKPNKIFTEFLKSSIEE